MPRIDFKLLDRVYLLKLICTVQMTFSSFVAILYFYLMLLQHWISSGDERPNILTYKWCAIVISILDFGLGTLLGIAANTSGNPRKRRIVIWVILETFYIPTCLFLLLRLYHKIRLAKTSLITDQHFERISLAQICFVTLHFLFIVFTIDFTISEKSNIKVYDPNIRPESVHEPTDPKITTTESRRIRMCQSFLFKPSTSGRSSKRGANSGTSSQ